MTTSTTHTVKRRPIKGAVTAAIAAVGLCFVAAGVFADEPAQASAATEAR